MTFGSAALDIPDRGKHDPSDNLYTGQGMIGMGES